MNILVKTIKPEEVENLRLVFQEMDKNGAGMINASELSEYIKKQHMEISDQEIQKLIAEIDYHGNGEINYSEFLYATIDTQKFLTGQRLRAIFNQFDTDKTEKITAENIQVAFQKLGQSFSMDELRQMIKKHDITGDEMLGFEEFKAIFFDTQN